MIKLVLVDTRDGSATTHGRNEFFLGTEQRILVQIPALVYHGWKCISTEMSIVLNLPSNNATTPSRTNSASSRTGTLPYDWTRKDG